MSTRDHSEALFYDLVGTLRETKVFGFRGKYSCEAEIAAPSVTTASKGWSGVSKARTVHLHVVATGKRFLQPVGSSRRSTDRSGLPTQ